MADNLDDWDWPSLEESKQDKSQKKRVGEKVRDVFRAVRDKLPHRKTTNVPEVDFRRKSYEADDEYDRRITRETEAHNAAHKKNRQRSKIRKSVGVATASAIALGGGITAARQLTGEDDRSENLGKTELPIETAVPTTEAALVPEITEPTIETTAPPETSPTIETTPAPTFEELVETTRPSLIIVTPNPAESVSPNHIDSAAQLNGEYDANRCDTIDVELTDAPNWEAIQRGAETEMALSPAQINEIKTRMEAAQSQEEVEAIAREVFAQFRINTSFEINLETAYPDSPDKLTKLRSDLMEHVRSLGIIPREFLHLTTLHELNIQSDPLRGGFLAPDTSPAGEYEAYAQRISVGLTYADHAMTHERGHGLQDYICTHGILNDSKFRTLFDEVMDGIKAEHPEAATYLDRYMQHVWGNIELSNEEWWQIENFFKDQGLPSAYTATDSNEMFAELFEILVMTGYTPGEVYEERGEAGVRLAKLQEAVVERAQAAMPDVDVAAWLQYVRYINQFGLRMDDVNPTDIAKLQASTLNVTLPIATTNPDGSISSDGYRQAVAIQSGKNTEYVYAHIDSGVVSVSIRTSENTELDTSIRSAIESYLMSLSPGSEITVTKDIEQGNNLTLSINSAQAAYTAP